LITRTILDKYRSFNSSFPGWYTLL
jgi:hypothetical protein